MDFSILTRTWYRCFIYINFCVYMQGPKVLFFFSDYLPLQNIMWVLLYIICTDPWKTWKMILCIEVVIGVMLLLGTFTERQNKNISLLRSSGAACFCTAPTVVPPMHSGTRTHLFRGQQAKDRTQFVSPTCVKLGVVAAICWRWPLAKTHSVLCRLPAQ